MSKHFLRWLAAGALTVIVVASVVGCWNPFAPESGGDTPPSKVQYKVRTTPDNVIYNLNTAYKWMNATEYLACLADNFEFVLNPDDVNDPENPLPETWGKQEERDIHEKMFSDTTDVDHVSLTLTNISIDFDQGEDPYSQDDDRYTYLEGTDLRVVIGDWTLVANADQEFVFQIDPNETGPDGETLWEIVEWYDIKPPEARLVSDGDGQVVPTTFGRLKAMYR